MAPASASALVGQCDSSEGCCESLWSGLQKPEYLDALFGSLLVPINVQWHPVVQLVQVKRWPAAPRSSGGRCAPAGWSGASSCPVSTDSAKGSRDCHPGLRRALSL